MAIIRRTPLIIGRVVEQGQLCRIHDRSHSMSYVCGDGLVLHWRTNQRNMVFLRIRRSSDRISSVGDRLPRNLHTPPLAGLGEIQGLGPESSPNPPAHSQCGLGYCFHRLASDQRARHSGSSLVGQLWFPSRLEGSADERLSSLVQPAVK